jgi:hypothetical protein
MVSGNEATSTPNLIIDAASNTILQRSPSASSSGPNRTPSPFPDDSASNASFNTGRRVGRKKDENSEALLEMMSQNLEMKELQLEELKREREERKREREERKYERQKELDEKKKERDAKQAILDETVRQNEKMVNLIEILVHKML